MKKPFQTLVIAFLLIFLFAAQVFAWGWGGPIPGVDIPIDPGAFWHPDIPDYADDGNIYSLRQLAKGSVYDHRRNVENIPITVKIIADVANSLAFIQNQALELTSLPDMQTHISALYGKLFQADSTFNASQGFFAPLSTEQLWGEKYPTFLSYYDRPNDYNTQNITSQSIVTMTDQTYQDSLQIIKNNAAIQADWQMLLQIFQQNKESIGNKQIQQINSENHAMQTGSILPKTQNMAALFSVMAANEKKKVQSEWADRQKTFVNANVGAADPYLPSQKDKENYNRPTGQGFIRF